MKYDILTVSNVEVNDVVRKVEVAQSRTICVGANFHMVPSMGYSGVDTGMVEIMALGSTEQLYANPVVSEETASDIGEFTEMDLQAYDENTEEYHNRQELLANGIWVVYRYTRPDLEGVWVFPIEEFLEHSVRSI